MKKTTLLLFLLFSIFSYSQNLNMRKLIFDAEKGDAVAQYVLGDCYERGHQVNQSYTNAAFWYSKSTAQNYANAQFKLGKLYADGLGVEQSYSLAIELWEISGYKGVVESQYNLGVTYFYGKENINADLKKSLFWFNMACENNDEESCKIINQYKQ